jgi:hypothetical protein
MYKAASGLCRSSSCSTVSADPNPIVKRHPEGVSPGPSSIEWASGPGIRSRGNQTKLYEHQNNGRDITSPLVGQAAEERRVQARPKQRAIPSLWMDASTGPTPGPVSIARF